MRQTYPSEGKDRFMIRLPDGMRDRLKVAADENKRTISAEIVARLEQSLRTIDETSIIVLDTNGDGYADAILSVNGKNYSFKVKEEKD